MPAETSRFLRACRGRKVDATPVWFMRQAGRYMAEYRELRRRHSILELARTPELACEVTLQPLRRIDVDAAILFADILLVAQALGLRLRFSPGPCIENPVRDARAVAALDDAGAAASLECVYRAVALVRRALEPGRALIGFAGAPFTVASYMVEGGPSDRHLIVKGMMESRPDLWEALMRKVRRATADYLLAQIAAGAQAVQLFDSWAGALPPEQYRRRVRPHTAWVLERVSRAGVPVISFATGVSGHLEDFAAAGGDVIGLDWRVDLDAARRRLPGRAVQGNLDPAALLAGPRALKAAVRDVLRRNGGRPGHVFNLGHGIYPETPVDQVRRAADWVHELSAR